MLKPYRDGRIAATSPPTRLCRYSTSSCLQWASTTTAGMSSASCRRNMCQLGISTLQITSRLHARILYLSCTLEASSASDVSSLASSANIQVHMCRYTGALSLCACLLLFLVASVSDPGCITEGNLVHCTKMYPYDGLTSHRNQQCWTCLWLRPARSKHCPVCNRYVPHYHSLDQCNRATCTYCLQIAYISVAERCCAQQVHSKI